MSIADLFGSVSPEYSMYAADKAKSEDYNARIKAYEDAYNQYTQDYDKYKTEAEAYNDLVTNYNEKLAAYTKDATAYNDALAIYKDKAQAYNDQLAAYKKQVEDYNAAVNKFNEGDRTIEFKDTDYYVAPPGDFTAVRPDEFTMVRPDEFELTKPEFSLTEPTAPSDPGFDQAEIDAFVKESQGRARRRGMANAAALNVLGQGGNFTAGAGIQGGAGTSTTPEFSFSSTSFEEGGVVPPPSESVVKTAGAPSARGLGYYIPPELRQFGRNAMRFFSAVDPAQGIMRGMAASGRAFDSDLTPAERRAAAIEAGLETISPMGMVAMGALAKQPAKAILMDMLTPTGATKDIAEDALGDPSKREFIKQAAATTGIAAVAPDLVIEAGEAVGKAKKTADKAKTEAELTTIDPALLMTGEKTLPDDITQDIKDLIIRSMQKTLEDQILKMRDAGVPEEKIEIYRKEKQGDIYEAQGLPRDIDDFYENGGEVLSPREASEQMGDIEYEVDMQPYLHDPLSKLGFDPKKIRVGNPQSADHYSPLNDTVTMDPNYGLLSKETQAHEFRHRGLQRLLEDFFMLDPGQFKRQYGQEAFNLMVKVHKQQRKRGPVEERVHERIAEMFQRPEELYLGTVYETSDARVFQTLADAEAYARDNPGVEFRASEVRPNLEDSIETPRVNEFRDYMINKNRGETMQQGTDAEFEAVRNIQNAAANVLAGRYANGGAVVTPATNEQLSAMRTKVINDYGFDPIEIALEEGVDPELYLRVMYTENKGRHEKKSDAGAIGLMQLMPGTAEELGVNPNNPVDNARGGARYLKKMLDRFESVPLALAAYNAGPGNVAEYGGVPPFEETQNYVAMIAPAITNENLQDVFNMGAENYLMAQPVATPEGIETLARDSSPRPQYRPFDIDYYMGTGSSPRPRLRPSNILTSSVHQQLNPALR